MRAKEYLEVNKQKLAYYDQVKKVIYDLYPLRNNRQKTEEYCSRNLFTDLQDHQTSNSTGGPPATDMNLESAIDCSIASQIRFSILKVINSDKTFLFAHNIIISKARIFDDLLTLIDYKLRDENGTSTQQIEQECQKYRDDYPKTNLSDFLLYKYNLEVYNDLQDYLLFDEDCWLFAFNKAYELFDRVRILFNEPFKAQYLIKNIYLNNKELERTIVDILQTLIFNCTYDLSDIQIKKLALLADKINEYDDEHYIRIDDCYLSRINKLKLEEVNWVKATKLFNYEIISLWVNHEAFNQEQRLCIIQLIEMKYRDEKQKNPHIFIYDLNSFFNSLRETVISNVVNDNVADYTCDMQALLDENMELKAKINQKDQEIEKLKESLLQLPSIQDNDGVINADETNTLMFDSPKGMTVPQLVLVFYYLFNELGVNFDNSYKTAWAKFIHQLTGKCQQNIRSGLNIDFFNKQTHKNMRYVASFFVELFPTISEKILNDIKE
ncbi:hypothetical protein [Proteiniphilum sp. UBA5384]|uniref:hypothetical protein n=1 Tax=Proteiniphilum sp. UBA5384 TaxID=1947279 RepID=UPI0025F0AF83|nr:hypothetical protein [Proteiniphilum sp. UBA5384]